MLEALTKTLSRLRQSLTGKADKAYKDRDKKGATTDEQLYAAGEGHAYGVASDEIRKEQERNS